MQIFISYRRADSADVSGRIYDRLVAHFGRASVFKDVDSIPLGVDFRHYVDRQIQQCDVALVVIGQQWLSVANEVGQRRIDDPNDNVLIEVEQAMQRDVPIIPVLVQGVAMPPFSQLPASIAPLVYRNAIAIHPDPDFHRDVDRLIHNIEAYTPAVAPSEPASPVIVPAPTPVSPSTPNVSTMAPPIKTKAVHEQSLSSKRPAPSLSSVVRNPALYIAIGGLFIFLTNLTYAIDSATSLYFGTYVDEISQSPLYKFSILYILISITAIFTKQARFLRFVVLILVTLSLLTVIYFIFAVGYLGLFTTLQLAGTFTAFISAIFFYRSVTLQTSPFEQMRHEDEEGEYWSARELVRKQR